MICLLLFCAYGSDVTSLLWIEVFTDRTLDPGPVITVRFTTTSKTMSSTATACSPPDYPGDVNSVVSASK